MHSCYKQVFYIIFQSSRAGADFTRSRVSQEVLTVLNPRWNEAECTSSGVGCGRTICCRSGGWKWSAGRSTLLSDNSNYPANGTLTERRSDSAAVFGPPEEQSLLGYIQRFSLYAVFSSYFLSELKFLPAVVMSQISTLHLEWFFFLFRRTCNELHGNNSKRGNFFFFLTFLLIIFEFPPPSTHIDSQRRHENSLRDGRHGLFTGCKELQDSSYTCRCSCGREIIEGESLPMITTVWLCCFMYVCVCVCVCAVHWVFISQWLHWWSPSQWVVSAGFGRCSSLSTRSGCAIWRSAGGGFRTRPSSGRLQRGRGCGGRAGGDPGPRSWWSGRSRPPGTPRRSRAEARAGCRRWRTHWRPGLACTSSRGSSSWRCAYGHRRRSPSHRGLRTEGERSKIKLRCLTNILLYQYKNKQQLHSSSIACCLSGGVWICVDSLWINKSIQVL